MATDLSGVILPHLKRITLGGSDVLTEVQLPDTAATVSFRFITNAGKVAVTGSDAGAIGSDYGTIDADTWVEMQWRGRASSRSQLTSVYLASGTGSTVVEVSLEPFGG
jgi:hypothetical protein